MNYVTGLREEMSRKLRTIESGEDNILKKSMAASRMLEEVFDYLKEFIVGYAFESEEEEINFFREVKPRFFCHLIYYRKIYNIEMNRPMGSVEIQRHYLVKELDAIKDYIDKRLDFYRYYRSDSTYLDCYYFIRGKADKEQYLDSFYFERDPKFSTCCDFKVARILANDMLQVYLRSELEKLDNGRRQEPFPKKKHRWTGKKNDLIEILYAFDEERCFDNGSVSLTELAAYFEAVFCVDLGNISRNFYEMKIRNEQTPFLDRLKEKLLTRMRAYNPKKRNKKG